MIFAKQSLDLGEQEVVLASGVHPCYKHVADVFATMCFNLSTLNVDHEWIVMNVSGYMMM
jgi:hypothetical protein